MMIPFQANCTPARLPQARWLLAALVTLTLAGCGEQPTGIDDMRSARDMRLAAGISNAGQPAAGVPVALSQGLGPALRAAVTSNEGYLGALALEAEAMGQVGVAASARRPQVTGNANIGGIRETNVARNTSTGVAGGLNLSQLVYDAGGSASAVNRATAQALAAQAARVAQGNTLALNAARAWIDVAQYTERLQLMRARTSEMDMLLGQIERMATNGMLDRAALDSARRQIVDITLEETRLEASLAEAQSLFHRFFHVQPRGIARPAELVSAAQARSFAQAWENAPDLQRQAAEAIAAQAAIGEAKSAFRPQVRVQTGLRSPLERDESTDLTVGVMLDYSFNDGGRRRNQLEAAEARSVATEAQLSDAQRGLQAELKGALTQLAALDRSMPLVAEKLRLSRSEAETSRSQLRTGQSNLRQLVEAEVETYRAQDQQVALRAERQILLLTIAARTGALGELINLDSLARN